MDKENSTNRLPTRINLTVRILMGAYLLYTAYSLTGAFSVHTGGERLFFLFFTAAFALIGAGLTLVSGRALVKGRYVGGALDVKKDGDGPEER